MIKKLIYSATLFVFPVIVFAQTGGLSQTRQLLVNFQGIITTLIIIATSIALLVFIWGLVKYIAKAEDEGAKEDGRRLMINGAIALFVLFSIFGIIRWIGIEVGVTAGENNPLRPPTVTF